MRYHAASFGATLHIHPCTFMALCTTIGAEFAHATRRENMSDDQRSEHSDRSFLPRRGDDRRICMPPSRRARRPASPSFSTISRACAPITACASALVTADGAPVAPATGTVRAGTALRFPTETVKASTLLPDLDKYNGPPLEYGRMEATASDPTCSSSSA